MEIHVQLSHTGGVFRCLNTFGHVVSLSVVFLIKIYCAFANVKVFDLNFVTHHAHTIGKLNLIKWFPFNIK